MHVHAHVMCCMCDSCEADVKLSCVVDGSHTMSYQCTKQGDLLVLPLLLQPRALVKAEIQRYLRSLSGSVLRCKR